MDTNNGFQFDFGSDESRWQQLLNEIDNENVMPFSESFYADAFPAYESW